MGFNLVFKGLKDIKKTGF